VRGFVRIAICFACLASVEPSAHAFVSPGYGAQSRRWNPLVGKWRLTGMTYKGSPMPTPQGFVAEIDADVIRGTVGALSGARYEIAESASGHLKVKIIRPPAADSLYEVDLVDDVMLVRPANASPLGTGVPASTIEMQLEREP
jgi:hypothetical protein